MPFIRNLLHRMNLIHTLEKLPQPNLYPDKTEMLYQGKCTIRPLPQSSYTVLFSIVFCSFPSDSRRVLKLFRRWWQRKLRNRVKVVWSKTNCVFSTSICNSEGISVVFIGNITASLSLLLWLPLSREEKRILHK